VTPYRRDMPWLLVGQVGAEYVVQDTRDGSTWRVPSVAQVHQIAADRSAAQGYRGLGDLVHRAASAVGAERCTPCAQRQVALNRALPRLWPSRGR
jgi:hypothetical protein